MGARNDSPLAPQQFPFHLLRSTSSALACLTRHTSGQICRQLDTSHERPDCRQLDPQVHGKSSNSLPCGPCGLFPLPLAFPALPFGFSLLCSTNQGTDCTRHGASPTGASSTAAPTIYDNSPLVVPSSSVLTSAVYSVYPCLKDSLRQYLSPSLSICAVLSRSAISSNKTRA